MTILIVLSIMYFFFGTDAGQRALGKIISNVIYFSMLLFNPISLILGFGVYLIFKGSA